MLYNKWTVWWCDPSNGDQAAVMLLLADFILSLAIIPTVGHWNVDWTSYMQIAGNITQGEWVIDNLLYPLTMVYNMYVLTSENGNAS